MSGSNPLIGIVMGSDSDWPTMRECAAVLEQFEVSYEAKVVSAHRTPNKMNEYAKAARERGLKLIIAGAGGAAHLPGMVASQSELPVLGVPIQSKVLNGLDSLLSIVQMPAGAPVATMAIGTSGAKNAAFFACKILAIEDRKLLQKLQEFKNSEKERIDKIEVKL